MSIDILIGETAANFGIGVALGYRMDRKYGPKVELSEYLKQLEARDSDGIPHIMDDKENDIYMSKSRTVLNRINGNFMKAYGCLAAIANEILISRLIDKNANPFYTMAAGGISMYVGSRFGEYLSRKKRGKAKLTREDMSGFNKLLSKFDSKGAASENFKENTEQISDYVTNIVETKGNVQIVRPIILMLREQLVITSILQRFTDSLKAVQKG